MHSILVFIYSAVRLTVTQNTIVTLHTEYSMPNSARHTSAHYVHIMSTNSQLTSAHLVLCLAVHNTLVLI